MKETPLRSEDRAICSLCRHEQVSHENATFNFEMASPTNPLRSKGSRASLRLSEESARLHDAKMAAASRVSCETNLTNTKDTSKQK